ncbi:MAG: hypothetical protein ACE5K4_01295 [Candidatus Hydrothermarchaeota archaeon]
MNNERGQAAIEYLLLLAASLAILAMLVGFCSYKLFNLGDKVRLTMKKYANSSLTNAVR